MSQDDTSQDRDDIREIFTDLDMGILTESEAAELLLASRSKLVPVGKVLVSVPLPVR